MERSRTRGRRDREVAGRRAEIIRAAARVFAEKGYQRATIREIAEKAEVAEGTIYNHFTNKADLLVALIEGLDSVPQQVSDLEDGLESDLRGFFADYLRRRLQRAGADFGLLLSLMPEVLADEELRHSLVERHLRPEMEAFEAHARARIARGEVRPLDIPLTVRILQSSILGLSLLQALGDPVTLAAIDEPERLIAALTSLMVDGLLLRGDRSPVERGATDASQ